MTALATLLPPVVGPNPVEGIEISKPAVPVDTRGVITRVLLVGYRVPHHFADEDLLFLENVAGMMGIALENTLFRESDKLAMLEERERPAREIHDGLAQSVSYLHLRLKGLALAAGAGSVP